MPALPEPIADSVNIAAFRLGICRAQLYKEIQAGRLLVRKLGRRTLILRSEQERFLLALPVKGASAIPQAGANSLAVLNDAELKAVIERGQKSEVAVA
jgi:hypothetical protein